MSVLLVAAAGCGAAGATRPAGVVDPLPGDRELQLDRTPVPWVSPNSYAAYVRGQVLAGRGDHAGAVQAFETAIAESGEDPWVESQLAHALSAQGKREAALHRLDRAIAGGARRPEGPYPALLTARGALREQMGDDAGALSDHTLAVRLDGRGQAVAPLAALLERLGQPERAVAVLETAADAHPRHGIASARLALRLALSHSDAAATDAALARLSGLRALSRGERLALARSAMAQHRPWLAARVLAPAPADRETLGLRLAALLAAEDRDAARGLLTLASPKDLGGPLPMARAWLSVGAPERALELVGGLLETSHAAAAPQEPPAAAPEARALVRDRARVIAAQAQLALGAPQRALEAVASIPRGSPLRPEAEALATRALARMALPASAADLLAE